MQRANICLTIYVHTYLSLLCIKYCAYIVIEEKKSVGDKMDPWGMPA